jgi:hypothetical protein
MKPVITFESGIKNKEVLQNQLQNLGKETAHGDRIEYKPKAKKVSEVVRILRENGILYEIRFDVGG